jgi:HEAT repeat protein
VAAFREQNVRRDRDEHLVRRVVERTTILAQQTGLTPFWTGGTLSYLGGPIRSLCSLRPFAARPLWATAFLLALLHEPAHDRLVMTKRRKLLVLLASLALAFGAYVVLVRQSEPRYQGRKLSEWLFEGYPETRDWIHRGLPTGPSTNEAFAKAMAHFGPRALPFLLEWTDYRGAPNLEDKLATFCGKWGPLKRLEKKLEDWRTKQCGLAYASALSFVHLGAEQKRQAIPILAERLFNTNDSMLSSMAGKALARLPPEGLELLASATTNSNTPDFHRRCCLFDIGSAGTNAGPAMPALLQCLKDPSWVIRDRAVRALKDIRLYPEVVVPALVNALKDTKEDVRGNAAEALRAYGKGATGAVPALLRAANDIKEPVRSAANFTLLFFREQQPTCQRYSLESWVASLDPSQSRLFHPVPEPAPADAVPFDPVTDATTTNAPQEVIVDPATGEVVTNTPTLYVDPLTGMVGPDIPPRPEEVDPATGEITIISSIEIDVATRQVITNWAVFDPVTGEVITNQSPLAVDPATGKIITNLWPAEAVGRIGAKAIPWLLNWLGNGRGVGNQLSDQAVCAFEFLGPEREEAVPGLLRLLQEPGWGDSACRAARVLRFLGKENEALPPLMTALTNQAGAGRMGALAAIPCLGTNSMVALPVFLQCLQDPEPAIRGGAALALASLEAESPLIVPALTNALHDPKWKVRDQATNALQTLEKSRSKVRQTNAPPPR